MATNDILKFADTSTNILTQPEYVSDPERPDGNQAGTIARSELVNKALLQTSAMAGGVGQFMADYQALNIEDSLTEAQVSQAMHDAVLTIVNNEAEREIGYATTTDQNDLILTPIPAYTSYAPGDSIFVKYFNTSGNSGDMTVNVSGLGVVPIKIISKTNSGLIDTPAGSMSYLGIYLLVYDGINFMLTNPTIVGSGLYAKMGLTGARLIPAAAVTNPTLLTYDISLHDENPTWINIGGSYFQPTIPGLYRLTVSQYFQDLGSGSGTSDCEYQLILFVNGAPVKILAQNFEHDVPTSYALQYEKVLVGEATVESSGIDIFAVYVALTSSVVSGTTITATDFYGNFESATFTCEYIGQV